MQNQFNFLGPYLKIILFILTPKLVVISNCVLSIIIEFLENVNFNQNYLFL